MVKKRNKRAVVVPPPKPKPKKKKRTKASKPELHYNKEGVNQYGGVKKGGGCL